MDNITNLWQQAREGITTPSKTTDELISAAKLKQRKVLYHHLSIIVILTVTLIGICLFFYYVALLKDLLSKTGIFFMISGLLIRIAVEVVSSIKSVKINLINPALIATNDALKFYNFRNTVHGPVTFITAGMYVIGVYLLTPEFSTYINLKYMIVMHVFFLLASVLLIWQAKKSINKEMGLLSNLAGLKKQMNAD